jgi:hypothetical protein
MSVIGRIQQKIRSGQYILSEHLINDKLPLLGLEREDIVHALLTGVVESKDTSDPRGTVYYVQSAARNGLVIEIPCRFSSTGKLIVITVYEP